MTVVLYTYGFYVILIHIKAKLCALCFGIMVMPKPATEIGRLTLLCLRIVLRKLDSSKRFL